MSGPNKAVAGTMPNMSLSKTAVTQKFAYFIAATIAIVCAAGLEVFGTLDTQPVIGDLSLLLEGPRKARRKPRPARTDNCQSHG